MREQHAIEHLVPVAVPDGEHRRREVAEPVDGEHRGVVERRDEERARDVRLMVLDVVHLGAQARRVDVERRRQSGADVAHLGGVGEPGAEIAGARPVPDRPHELRADIGPRVARDRDVVEILGCDPGVLEAPRRGEVGEAGAVRDPVEALLLGGVHEHAVDHERRRSVAVIRVETEDRRHGADRSRSLGTESPVPFPVRCAADIIATSTLSAAGPADRRSRKAHRGHNDFISSPTSNTDPPRNDGRLARDRRRSPVLDLARAARLDARGVPARRARARAGPHAAGATATTIVPPTVTVVIRVQRGDRDRAPAREPARARLSGRQARDRRHLRRVDRSNGRARRSRPAPA